MVHQELHRKNGYAAPDQEQHKNVKSALERYSAHLLSAAIPVVISIIIYLGMHGWVNAPAKDNDLQAFKNDVASRLDGNRQDHTEFKAILNDLQRSQFDTVVKLTAIAAILAERSSNPPPQTVTYTPAGVLPPPPPKKPKPPKIDPPDSPGAWIAKQLELAPR